MWTLCGTDAAVVGDDLEHEIAAIDEFAGNVGEGIYQDIAIEALLTQPYTIKSCVFWCKIDGVVSRIRFLSEESGKRAPYIVLIVPPMQ